MIRQIWEVKLKGKKPTARGITVDGKTTIYVLADAYDRAAIVARDHLLASAQWHHRGLEVTAVRRAGSVVEAE